MDLYEESKGAVRLGVEFGKLLEGEVYLVLVYPRFPSSPSRGSQPGLRRGPRKMACAKRRRPSRSSPPNWREKGGVLRSRAAVGDAATAILEAAEEGSEQSLILTGGRDLGQLVRIRLGSVSSGVLRAAGGPVLIHKRPAS